MADVVPAVSFENLRMMWSLFSIPSRNRFGAVLKYIETLFAEDTAEWKVEYKLSGFVINDLPQFKSYIKDRVPAADLVRVRFNGHDRIYIFVLAGKPVERNDKDKDKIKTSRQRTRDAERSEKFKKEVAVLEAQAITMGASKLVAPLQQKKKEYSAFVSSIDVKKMERMGLGTGKFSRSESSVERKEELGFHEQQVKVEKIVTTARNFEMEHDIVRNSVKHTQMYVTGMFSDEKFVLDVRLYLGYLRHSQDHIVNDKTALSLELSFKTKGLPIGAELLELYLSVMEARGFSREQVLQDLQVVGDFERSQRLIRIQTAREKMAKWYSIPGKTVKYMTDNKQYFEVHTQLDGNRIVQLAMTDSCGVLRGFA